MLHVKIWSPWVRCVMCICWHDFWCLRLLIHKLSCVTREETLSPWMFDVLYLWQAPLLCCMTLSHPHTALVLKTSWYMFLLPSKASSQCFLLNYFLKTGRKKCKSITTHACPIQCRKLKSTVCSGAPASEFNGCIKNWVATLLLLKQLFPFSWASFIEIYHLLCHSLYIKSTYYYYINQHRTWGNLDLVYGY